VLETRTGGILHPQFSYGRVILQSLEKEGNESNEDHQETEFVRAKQSIRLYCVLAGNTEELLDAEAKSDQCGRSSHPREHRSVVRKKGTGERELGARVGLDDRSLLIFRHADQLSLFVVHRNSVRRIGLGILAPNYAQVA
jgi:hypothetical protein